MKCVIADNRATRRHPDRDEQHHAWVTHEIRQVPPKMLSCEAVLAEVHFLTQRNPEAKHRIESWLADGRLELPFTVRDHHSHVHELMARYASIPMSFADACLVRMSELWPEAPIFTLDSDFRVNRRNKRQIAPVDLPMIRLATRQHDPNL